MRLPYKLALLTWLLIVAFVYYFETSWLRSSRNKSHSQNVNYITLTARSHFESMKNPTTTESSFITNSASNVNTHKTRPTNDSFDRYFR